MRDKDLELVKSGSLTTAAVIGVVIDLGSVKNAYNDIFFEAQALTNITGNDTITSFAINIEGASDEAFTTPVVLITGEKIATPVAAGINWTVGRLPAGNIPRYIRAKVASVAAAGTVNICGALNGIYEAKPQ